MQVALLSPYHGGSHKAWAEGYQKYSDHDVTLLTLPDRFWKWRMHGGAVTMARRFLARQQQFDVFLATDMLDLTTFLALTRRRTSRIPVALYMHENQLTYPLPEDKNSGPMRRQLGERDMHYAFINYTSLLAADLVLFNSHYHHNSFFAALPNFLKHFPEYNELETIAELQARSQILPVGIDLRRLEWGDGKEGLSQVNLQSPIAHWPLILWNQRWEYDKNPAEFFAALYAMAEQNIPFRLALCGQRYGKQPSVFDEALARLSDRIVHVGYAEEGVYRSLLWQAAVTVSTAQHEFFGISVLEAIYCHTFPILPYRLTYPEFIPEAFRCHCLYHNQSDLVERLRWALSHPAEAAGIAVQLAITVPQYDWSHLAPRYDEALANLTSTGSHKRLMF
jgi:glycosyltransferase involved in cell wall biosynthesis